MKIIYLFLLSLAIACNRSSVKLLHDSKNNKGSENQALSQLPVALWLDANAQKSDRDFRNGLRDLSQSGRNCLSNVYPEISFELPTKIPVFSNTRNNYLFCEDMDLSFLNEGKYSVVMAFIPRLGTDLIRVQENGENVLSLHWLAGEGFIVQTGSGSETFVQKATINLPKHQIAFLKFTFDQDEPLFEDRQKLWINGIPASLSPVTEVASGEITNILTNALMNASTGTQISTLLFLDNIPTPEQDQEINCYFKKRFNSEDLSC